MFLKNIQLLTFDVHNVLLTIRNGAASQYARLARQHIKRPSIDEALLRPRLIKAFQTLNRTYPGYGIHHEISSRQWWTLLIDQTFADYRLTSDELQRLGTIIYDEFAKGELWIKHPQADHVLNELSKRYVLGAISNFDERLESLLEQHQLRSYFRFVLTPRTCGFYKPQKEIFIHAMQQMNLKSNEAMCHIGDDIQLDYNAAKAAGCRALLLVKDESSKQKLIDEHATIPSTDVLLDLTELLD